jgi:uncharacterized membrane protein YphA (DoxX/SURF4 family)
VNLSRKNPPARRAAVTDAPAPATPALAGRAGGIAAAWAPTGGRVLLGLVLAWFGYHELVQPGLWTGYVPLVSPGSALAALAVLAHGWLLLVLATALICGLVTRVAAAVAAVLLAEIVISLIAVGGLSDLTMRDAGVLGLAVCLTGQHPQRLVLRR